MITKRAARMATPARPPKSQGGMTGLDFMPNHSCIVWLYADEGSPFPFEMYRSMTERRSWFFPFCVAKLNWVGLNMTGVAARPYVTASS